MPLSFLRTTRASEVRSYRCRGRYLPATSWKLVRFGFPGSYIANLVGSRDHRNDRFDRSWIFARCFAAVSSPARPVLSRPVSLRCPFPFFFISTYVFRAACFYRHEWDFMTSRHPAVPLPASSPLLSSSSCDRRSAIPARIGFYIGKNAGQPSRIPRGLFRTRNYSSSSLTSADSRGYKFSFGNACSVHVESFRLTPHDEEVAE